MTISTFSAIIDGVKKCCCIPTFFLLLGFFLVACGSGRPAATPVQSPPAPGGPPFSDQSGGGYNPGGQVGTPSQPAAGEEPTPAFGLQDCPQSSPVSNKPEIPGADSLQVGAWYANAEGSLWAGTPPNGVRQGKNTFVWIKPGGSPLQISGQRLDMMAAPLQADIPPETGENYVTAALDFPTGGCWQVSARAGSQDLQFILYVAP